MARLMLRVFQFAIGVCFAVSIIHYYLQNKRYIFRTAEVQKMVEKYKGQHPDQCLGQVMADLSRRFSDHVKSTIVWNQVHFGGITARMLILHASFTEFVVVYGIPIGGTSFSGVHWANTTCTLLTGNVERWSDKKGSVSNRNLASPTKPRYNPGETFRILMLHSSTMKYSDDTWLVCYGRGFLPASYPYVFGSGFLRTFDAPGLLQLSYLYGDAALSEIVICFAEFWLKAKQLIGLA